MIKIKDANSYDKDKIYSFLKHTKYREFNLWPNVNDDNIAKFLFEGIDRIRSKGKIFIATEHNIITVLLAVKNLFWYTQHFGFKCAKVEYLLTNKPLLLELTNFIKSIKGKDKILVKPEEALIVLKNVLSI